MPSHYDHELKELDRCLKALPASIPVNNFYSFHEYAPTEAEIEDYGAPQSVINKHLEPIFGGCKHGLIKFRGQEPSLEAVVPILQKYITGKEGENIILIKWVDNLTEAAKNTIQKDGG